MQLKHNEISYKIYFVQMFQCQNKTITDDVNETFYELSRKIAKNVSFEEITLEFYTSVNFEERLFFEYNEYDC